MNKFLKFSWSHIFTFLAVILMAYFSFLGVSYWTHGNFFVAGIVTAVIVVLLIFWFVTAQMLKGTSGQFMKFKKSIAMERFLIFSCPVIFILCLGPLVHFWNVHSHNDEIVQTFKDGINASTGLFDLYENYANERLEAFSTKLQSPPANAESAIFKGISSKDVQREVMKQSLNDKLLGSNFTELKEKSAQWIQNANQEPSTWNVFLLGNIKEIKNSMIEWRDLLSNYSSPVLNSEKLAGSDAKPFDDDHGIINNAVGILDRLDAYYSTMEGPKPAAIGFAIAIFFLLLFPYLLQSRHSKSVYRLLSRRKSLGGMSLAPEVAPQPSAAPQPSTAPQQPDVDVDLAPKANTPSSNSTDDDFGMFKL